MDNLRIYNEKVLTNLVSNREGESKLGQKCQIPKGENIDEILENSSSNYVVFGIEEDLGVHLNKGVRGASKAWFSALKSLLNVQDNRYNNSNDILILGSLCFADEDFELDQVDDQVSELVSKIIVSGKFPIIIGGGHNNSYGNIKGLSLAKGTSVNVINFDAHTDLRQISDSRHSGNGFSYCKSEGYLNKYSMFGIHKNYTPEYILEDIDEDKKIKIKYFENLMFLDNKSFKKQIYKSIKHINKDFFGVEIDLDAIENFSSSAITSSGFSANECRLFVKKVAKQKNAKYLHLCEAIPNQERDTTGKLISYLITDFIRNNTKTNK
ncbi:MAG: formimidoylglutamase [Flavobacteriaceae bacterium]|nr:formimidoylglutamase [Flavobacteriaceae bacterium]